MACPGALAAFYYSLSKSDLYAGVPADWPEKRGLEKFTPPDAGSALLLVSVVDSKSSVIYESMVCWVGGLCCSSPARSGKPRPSKADEGSTEGLDCPVGVFSNFLRPGLKTDGGV